MLAAATSSLGLFGKSSHLSAYTIHSASPSSSSTHLPSASTSAGGAGPSQNGGISFVKPFSVGVWRIIAATHKTTGKMVSVWQFEKRLIDNIRDPKAKEQVLSALKKEATSLSRLRHPDLLQMIEPLEESRTDLSFATEYVTSSLSTVLHSAEESLYGPGSGSRRNGRAGKSSEMEIDEVEIQKGVLQLARALSFLHNQAKLVHLNISPEAILINAKGDWKLSGLSLTTPLHGPDGRPSKYIYPEYDNRLPRQVQWKLDYLAPEYALDSQLSVANDLYSIGCLLYAVHLGGKPPFQNENSMQALRNHAETELKASSGASWRGGRRWEQASPELKELLPRLITRTPQTRLSLASLPNHPYFSSLAINTLNFLDPVNFASKPREEKSTFLKGLLRVLPGFSERLRKKKILPSLLDEMKDSYLLPFLLPNIFEICKDFSQEEFGPVLDRLQPLFAIPDPPATLLLLLDQLPLFAEKTTAQIFREKVMDLVYHSLSSDFPPVQEKVLKAIPQLCDRLDYGTIQDVVLIVFTQTRLLSVKVQTLECFLGLVPVLNKSVLTQKLVPLLSKIKTKEPAVMMATLSVHEAMGAKVDRESVASLVLPQLWTMSMGPLLSVDQFQRFMSVIKSLGQRVEKEHAAHLRAVRGAEAQTSVSSTIQNDGWPLADQSEVDFATLVKNGTSDGTLASSAMPTNGQNSLSDDVWGSDSGWPGVPFIGIPDLTTSMSSLSTLSQPMSAQSVRPQPPPSRMPSSSATTANGSRLKARPIPSSNFDQSAFAPPNHQAQSTGSGSGMMSPLQPSSTTTKSLQSGSAMNSGNKPNYNISLTPQAPTFDMRSNTTPVMSSPMQPMMMSQPPASVHLAASNPPPWMATTVLQPTKVQTWQPSKSGSTDWSDFDPLK